MRRITAIVAAVAMFATPVMAQGTIKANSDNTVIKPAPMPNGEKAEKADVHFRACKDARAAGYSRMRTGQPGYAPHLDRDNDGIACE